MKTSQANTITLPNTGFLRVPQVAFFTGMCKSTIWQKSSEGKFPKPVKMSQRITGWRVEDIRAWLADPQGWVIANTKEA